MSAGPIVSITVTNNSTAVSQLNNAGQSVGMQPVSENTPVTQAAQQFEQSLMSTLTTTQWAKEFPNVTLPATNTDNGYMGPFTSDIVGTAPQCIVTQVGQDFSNWGLPTNTTLPTTIATTVANELVFQGGVQNFIGGTFQVSSNENICWLAGYGSFDVTQSELGVVWVFAAALSF